MAYLALEEARAVLSVAQEGGYEVNWPESEDNVVDLAEFYIKEAERESKDNAKMRNDPTIKQILSLKSTALTGKSERAFQQFAGETLEFEPNLPIPQDIEREPTPLPSDFTSLADKEVRRLHGEYNSYLGRARWLLATTSNKLNSATHLRDDAYRKSYKKWDLEMQNLGQKATKDLIDAMAKEEEVYLEWDVKVRGEQEKVTIYKALVEIYSSNVSVLSREWSMRIDEEKRY
jgi:hypothetical protein